VPREYFQFTKTARNRINYVLMPQLSNTTKVRIARWLAKIRVNHGLDLQLYGRVLGEMGPIGYFHISNNKILHISCESLFQETEHRKSM